MVGKDQINIAHDDDCLTGSSLKSFVSPFLKCTQYFEACRSKFLESGVKQIGSAARPSGSIGDHLRKLHQDLLQPANCPMNTLSILE
jgi:hypothetical protein